MSELLVRLLVNLVVLEEQGESSRPNEAALLRSTSNNSNDSFCLLLLTLAAPIIAGRPVLWHRSTPGTPLLWMLVLEIHVSSWSDLPQQEVAVVSMYTKQWPLKTPLKSTQIGECSASLA